MPRGGGSLRTGEGGLPGLKERTGRRREAPVSDAGRPLRRQEEPEREQRLWRERPER